MYLRCIFLIVCVTVIAALLLAIRQQRVELTSAMASLHRQGVQARYDVWQSQGQVAGQLNPRRLHQAIAQAKLDLEPTIAELVPRVDTERPMLATGADAAAPGPDGN